MTIVDTGSGPAIVLIPGVQGRWEWMRPAVDALSRHCRVITFSLDERADTFLALVEQAREAMDVRGLDRAVICGVSYGGLIAAALASEYPSRVAGLALVSALPPTWEPDARVRFYLRAPRLLAPLFCVASLRMYREIAAAAGGTLAGLPVAARHGWNVVTHMFSPAAMARRASLLPGKPLADRLATMSLPALVITGEESLDRVVPVRLTREYLRLLPQAASVTLPRTGHLSLITRPDLFAAALAPFAREAMAAPRRRVG
jgi:pimeloyl-ACP methyl ester carboxylesterase